MKIVRAYIGIDNGVTGSVGVIAFFDNGSRETFFIRTPSFMAQDYTKAVSNVSRLKVPEMRAFLSAFPNAQVLMERPHSNMKHYKQTISAARCMEATMIVVESLNLPKEFCDSKEWQKELLPRGTKTSPQLKKASLHVGSQLFPEHAGMFKSQGDADGMLIAELCRRKYK